MSLQNWAVGAAAKGMIKDAVKDGRVKELSDVIDGFVKGFFPGQEKEIKQLLVEHLVFPICKELLKDDDAGLAKAKASL